MSNESETTPAGDEALGDDELDHVVGGSEGPGNPTDGTSAR